MKNFIEIETKDGRMLINVSHIISVKEVVLNNEHLSEISLINDRTEYDVKDINARPTKYMISKDTYSLGIIKPYDEVIELIKKAICQE